MPKKIFTQFEGLADQNRNIPDNLLAVMVAIDLQRTPGFLKPAFLGSALSTTPISNVLLDMVRYSDTIGYAIESGKLQQINNAALRNDATFPHTVSTGNSVTIYTHKKGGVLTSSIFYLGTGAATGGWTDASTFDDDYLNTVPSGAANFGSVGAERAKTIWQSNLMIADGRYVFKYDGINGNDGTVTAQYFDVGFQWLIKDFFLTGTVLGIVSRGFYSDDISEIALIDGSSATGAIKRFTVNERICCAIPGEGEPLFFTQDKSGQGYIKRIVGDGLETVLELKIENPTTGSIDSYAAPTRFSEVDVHKNGIIFSAKTGTTTSLLYFRRKAAGYSYRLQNLGTSPSETVNSLKSLDTGILYEGGITSSTKSLTRYASSYPTTAKIKTGYVDMGQQVRINYVKIYFKTLVADDFLTPTLEVDYGTSKTLKDSKDNATISFSNDGAITKKKFKTIVDCHAFRVSLLWNAGSAANTGGIAVGKIVVDYDFLPDDN